MEVWFRADASVEIGLGHIMRCYTLAEELRRHGATVRFASRRLPGNANDWLASKGFEVLEIQASRTSRFDDIHCMANDMRREADWLVVDSYNHDASWHRQARNIARHVLVIDDLANRTYDCKIIVDPNHAAGKEERYRGRTPRDCIKLLGPKFALLRREFREQKPAKLATLSKVERVLVCFGGTDPTGETVKVLRALQDVMCCGEFYFDVVVGRHNPDLPVIQKYCMAVPNCQLHIQSERMAFLMKQAHLAICAGGSLTWERYCMGLPALIITVADNQVGIATSAHEQRLDYYLGSSANVQPQMIRDVFRTIAKKLDFIQEARENAFRLVDGLGAERVARAMEMWGIKS